LRKSSRTFGKWTGFELSEENKRVAWVPEGFAHGFLVLSESADVLYKATAFFAPESERTIAWNDPDLGIGWPLRGEPMLSAKDRHGVPFAKAETYK
jgi:dTDP-4-dehydrorhamnose 3,5-epimerase